VYWDLDCQWSDRLIRQLQTALHEDSFLQRYPVDILWVHRARRGVDSSDLRHAAAALGLTDHTVLLATDDEVGSLTDQLRIDGTPWVDLVLPGQRVAFEHWGYGNADWLNRLEDVLAAYYGDRATHPAPP